MGYIMAECKTCGIEILDETEVCPLCKSILVQTDELENMYPDARVHMRKLLRLSRIYLFCAIMVEALLVTVDMNTPSPFQWSILTGFGLISVYIALRYAILGRSGHQTKIILMSILAVLIAVGVDWVIGFDGWSLRYVLPGGIVAVDAGILLAMMINRRNWQSYIMSQLVTILCSLIPAILTVTGLVAGIPQPFLPLGISLLLFLGTMMLGERRASLELKRRFHIK